MKKKIELTQEQLDKYASYLDARAAAARAEISKQERHIKRCEARKINLEASLRSELSEGTIGVYRAIGLPVPEKVKKETKEVSTEEVSRNHGMVEEKKKDGWGWS